MTMTEPEKAAPAAGRLDFDGFTAALDEPEALVALRRTAWERYTELPFPTRKTEEWRYTDLPAADLEAYEPAPPRHAVDDALPAWIEDVLARSGDRAGIVVQRNGRIEHLELSGSVAARGVVLCSIEDAAREHPELLDRTLLRATPAPMEEKLWTLQMAFLSGGYVLHVPRDVQIEAPIHVFRVIDRPGALVSTLSVILGESGSEGAVIDEFVSGDVDAVSLHGALIHGEANAGLDFVALQRYGPSVKHFSIQHAEARRDARVKTCNVQLGASLARADVSSRLLGPGCDSEMLALWLGDAEQHFDHHTLQHHTAPHAHSDLLFKGALTDAASSVFRGLIRVDEGAQLTDAYQTNRNLLLSEDAHATSLPNLEIEADDVRCSHGATIGQVDEAQLFYLMTRGLSRERAERLLVLGFFGEVLGRIPMAGVRERVREAIEEKAAI